MKSFLILVPFAVIVNQLFVSCFKVQSGPSGGVFSGRGPADQPGDHEPLGGAARLPGPGQWRVEGSLPAAPAEPQRQRTVDPGLHGEGRGGACGVGPPPYPGAYCGRAHSVPVAASAPRCTRVRWDASPDAAFRGSTCEQHNQGCWQTLICRPRWLFLTLQLIIRDTQRGSRLVSLSWLQLL